MTLDLEALRGHARELRRAALQMVHLAQTGSVADNLAVADLLAVLYFQLLRVDPASPHWPDRDRFVLSLDAAAPALYAALARRGFFPLAELSSFGRLDARLQVHPDMVRLPGLDMSTGSPGQGLSAAVGMALGARLRGKPLRTYALLSTAEGQEGQVWEAALTAARERLDGLTAIVAADVRGPLSPGRAPLEQPVRKLEAFGWRVFEVPGNDPAALLKALQHTPDGRPTAVVADVLPGCGVSFMEGDLGWRGRVPDPQELAAALAELGGELLLGAPKAEGLYEFPRSLRPNMPSTQYVTPDVSAPTSQREAFGKALVELGHAHPELVVLEGDATRTERFAEAFPERFRELGGAAPNMLGVAAGLATMGWTPWACALAPWLVKRGLDQVRVQIAQSGVNVKLVGSYAGQRGGKTLEAIADLAVMRTIPDMLVLAPADGVEAALAMAAMQEHVGPAYIRLHREAGPTLFDARHYVFKPGAGVVLREGRDLAILATGVQTARAVVAAQRLAERGIGVYLLHLPTLKPLDELGILAAARATGRVLVTEEHSRIGGLGSAVAEVLAEQHPVPVLRHGLDDCFTESAPEHEVLEKYGLSTRHLVEAALGWLAKG